MKEPLPPPSASEAMAELSPQSGSAEIDASQTNGLPDEPEIHSKSKPKRADSLAQQMRQTSASFEFDALLSADQAHSMPVAVVQAAEPVVERTQSKPAVVVLPLLHATQPQQPGLQDTEATLQPTSPPGSTSLRRPLALGAAFLGGIALTAFILHGRLTNTKPPQNTAGLSSAAPAPIHQMTGQPDAPPAGQPRVMRAVEPSTARRITSSLPRLVTVRKSAPPSTGQAASHRPAPVAATAKRAYAHPAPGVKSPVPRSPIRKPAVPKTTDAAGATDSGFDHGVDRLLDNLPK